MSCRGFALLAAAILVFSVSAGCRSASYGNKGSLLGGLVGAGTGAAIGSNSGNPVAGALIGGTVGAVTGGAIGESIDEDVARNRAEVEARMGRQMAAAVTPEDVVAMSQAGLSDDVIASHIRAHGVARPPQVNDLITLRNQGVSDNVLKAMQTSTGPQPTVVPASGASPVIIQERVYAPPPYYGPYWGPAPYFGYRYSRPYHGPHRGRSGYSLGFSFAN